MMLAVRLTALFAATAVLSGCGTAGSPRDVYIKSANRVCRDENERAQHPSGADDAAGRFAFLTATNKRLATRLKALTGPADLTKTVRDAAALIAQSVPVAEKMVADLYAVEHSNVSPDKNAKRDAKLIAQADALLNRANRRLKTLGIQGCA
jgi:hypothetical protein